MATVEALPVLDPDTIFGRGGFGELYADPRDLQRCIKVLKSPLTGDTARQILRLVDIAKWATPSDLKSLTSRFAWPIEVFGSKSAISGFTMPRSPASTRFELTAGRNTQTRDLQAKFLMDSAYWKSTAITSPAPDFSTADRIEVLLDLFHCILVLHRNGLTYGDISSNNVAIRNEALPGVFLFDADSITVPTERARQPIVSPGWEVPAGLSPLEIDRARLALFAIRLFTEQPSVFATDEALRDVASRTNEKLASALKDLFSDGSAQSIDSVGRSLAALRDKERGAAAFDAAVESGFASWVLRESAHATGAAEKKWVALAESQVLFEHSVRGMSGRQRRSTAYREKLQRSHFVLDVPPIASLQDPPGSVEELKDLIFETMFEELAGHLVLEGLDSLENHDWLRRAVDRALIEARDPEVFTHVETGRLSIRFWWPVEQFVNAAELRIVGGGLDEKLTFRRGDADSQLSREVQLPEGGQINLAVRVGAQSPTGEAFWCSRLLQSDHLIPAVPRTNRPTVGGVELRSTGIAAVIDPEEERQRLLIGRLQREQAEADARSALRRKRQRLALSSVAAAFLTSSVAYMALNKGPFAMDVESRETEFEAERTVVADSLERGIGRPDVTLRGTTVMISWEPPRSANGDLPLRHEVYVGSAKYVAGPHGRFAVGVEAAVRINPVVVAYLGSGEKVVSVGSSSLVAPEHREVEMANLGPGTALSIRDGEVSVVVEYPDGVVDGSFIIRWINLDTSENFFSAHGSPGTWVLPINDDGRWKVSAQFVDTEGRSLSPPAFLGTVGLNRRGLAVDISSLQVSPESTAMSWRTRMFDDSTRVAQIMWTPGFASASGPYTAGFSGAQVGTVNPTFVIADGVGSQALVSSDVIVHVPDNFAASQFYGVGGHTAIGFGREQYFLRLDPLDPTGVRSYELVYVNTAGATVFQSLGEGRNELDLERGHSFVGAILVHQDNGPDLKFDLPVFEFIPGEFG